MSDLARLHRGLVLQALHAQYPLALTEVALERQVAAIIGGGAVLERTIAYLVEKGLVERNSVQLGQRRLSAVKLRVSGVDLVEGTTTDPAIDLSLA